MKKIINITINNEQYSLAVEPNRTLADMLRYDLSLTGTKKGCDSGDCGACTVIFNGDVVNSCLVLAIQADEAVVETIEGLETEQGLHPLQEAFVEKGAIQCGYCSPGMILSAKNLLDKNENPSNLEIRKGISGNLCRCTGYQKIFEAIESQTSQSCQDRRNNE
ncbi:MAG: (2Fe-2S)-binding protein [Desulfobacteraceae bacterium]|nr:(2Fe-2S)-binding protein [Desulfobacteraceae bacterium]